MEGFDENQLALARCDDGFGASKLLNVTDGSDAGVGGDDL